MSIRSPTLVLAVVALAAAGCTGHVETQKLSDAAMTNTEKRLPGIVYYQPALFAEKSLKTTLIVNGKPAGSSADSPPACMPVAFEKVVTLPDLKNPYLIAYEAALFETNKFGVSLNNGMLAAVNADPAPINNGSPANGSTGLLPGGLPPIPTPLGIPLSAPAAPGFDGSAIRRVDAKPDLPACTDGPVIVGYRRLSLP